MFKLYLEILAGEKIHRRILDIKEGGKLYVGAENCDVNLPHRSIGKRHFGFGVKNGKLFAGDLGCRGGTLYNGHPFKQGYVKTNDIFQAGPFRVRIASFELAKVETPAHAHVDGDVTLPFLRGDQSPVDGYRDFFKAFFADPLTAWDGVARRASIRELGIALGKNVAVMTIATLLAGYLRVGFAVNPIHALMALVYGTVWMLAGWAIGTVILYYLVLPLMKAKFDWGSLLSYLIACAALNLPLLVLTSFGFDNVAVLAHMAFCFYGSWRMFQPDRGRFLVIAGGCAMLMIMSTAMVWRTERSIGQLEKTIASFERTIDHMPREISGGK